MAPPAAAKAGAQGLIISVTPSQSAYFAGEDFSCTISFTNTRSPAPPAPRFDPYVHHHQRARTQSADFRGLGGTFDSQLQWQQQKALEKNAFRDFPPPSKDHSNLHAPHTALPGLSRPPLPSVPFPASPTTPKRPLRTTSGPIPAQHPHSRRLSIAPNQQAEDLNDAFNLAAELDYDDDAVSVTSSAAATPFGGGFDTPTSAKHGRTASAADFYSMGRNDTMESLFRDSVTSWSKGQRVPRSAGIGGVQQPPSPSPFPGPSTSRFSRRNSSVSISSPTFGPGSLESPLFPSSFAPPGTETVLWSFAQLSGSFEVNESLVKPAEFDEVKRALAQGGSGGGGGVGLSLRPGTRGRTVGGGSLGVEEEEDYAGWTSYLMGWGGSRKVNGPVSGGSLDVKREKTLGTKGIPTFQTPPSILVVDMQLAPGETRTFSFTHRLATDLPPSFKGRSISFIYNLVLGTNRRTGPPSAPNQGQRSRVIQVPIRVFNNVSISGVRPFYDLLNPVIIYKDEARVRELEEGAEGTLSSGRDESRKAARARVGGRRGAAKRAAADLKAARELEQYALDLLDSCEDVEPEEEEGLPEGIAHTDVAAVKKDGGPPPVAHSRTPSLDVNGSKGHRKRPSLVIAEKATKAAQEAAAAAAAEGSREDRRAISPISSPEASPPTTFLALPEGNRAGTGPKGGRGRRRRSSFVGLDEAEDLSCKAAVEIVSRNSQKASYDISKDGEVVAVLTLTKMAYRLGETVNGVVTLNASKCRARVIRFAAKLESDEAIESSIATRPSMLSSSLLCRVHSEHHEATMDLARASFALPIPSGATPDFSTSGVRLRWSVRLSFLVQSAPSPAQGSRHGHAPLVPPPPPPHLVPDAPDGFAPYHTAYRAVPDLSLAPPSYIDSDGQASVEEAFDHGPPPPSSSSSSSLSSPPPSLSPPSADASPSAVWPRVLKPKVETVECSVPVSVYPGNTPFRPVAASFAI